MRRVLFGVGIVALAGSAAPVAAQAVGYDPGTNRSYILNTTPQTWTDARAAAVAAGRDLASIGGASENELVNAVAPGDAWIGFTDDAAFGGTEFGDTSGQPYPPGGNRGAGWVWSDGTPPTYQNWGAGEPNNAGGAENFANIRGDGQWNDLPNALVNLSSVQEVAGRVAGVTYNGHEYLIVTGGTWAQARAQAQALGGDLVVINDQAENDFVNNLVSGSAWIGLTDNESAGGSESGDTSGLPYPAAGNTPSDEAGTQRGEGWVNVDGTPLLYQNWRGGEPNDVGGEDFAEIVDDGGWNDLPDSPNFLRVGVVEIIPEPASLSLAALGGLLALRRRR